MLFLDEIQNIDGWDKFVQRLADNKYRAYVTGSNAKMLSQDVATTLGDDTLQYMYTLMILKSFFMLMGLKLQRILYLQQRAGQK